MHIEVSDIQIKYGKHCALNHISCAFYPGWTHIVGPNGAGKSTFLKLLAGLIEPDGGSVMLEQQNLRHLSALARACRIAYVPQRLESVPALSVTDFVAQGCYAWHKLGRMDALEMHQRALEALAEFGMTSFAARRMDQLSGGEVQLCVLASAVAQKVDIILLDEPTTGLDVCHIVRFCEAVERLKARGITVISSTHDLCLAARYGDAFVMLKSGRCLHAGAMPEAQVWGDVFDIAPDSTLVRQIMDAAGQVSSVSSASAPEVSSLLCVDKTKPRRGLIIWGTICALVLLVCPFVGATALAPWDGGIGGEVFWNLRVPRVMWGALSGAVLAICGATLQALFQNPLATPYTLGVASGASLGAMAAIQLGVAGVFGVPLAACVGGLLSMFAVLGIAARYGLRQPIYCLMAGVTASMFCSAVGMVIQSFASPLTAQQMMRWQLGGLEVVGYSGFATVPVIILAAIYLFLQAQPINLMSVDSELAATRGISVERTRVLALLSAGIATSIVVSMCGPIGFIGLIIPNALRRLLGADLRRILPLSALIGATFVMMADSLSRLLESIAWIPVGVVTAVIGAPIFIISILRR